MNPISFTIRFEAPIGLTIELQKELHVERKQTVRILAIEIKRAEGNIYDLTLKIHPDDLDREKTPPEELLEFRDRLISAIAITAAVPVRLLSKGVFTFSVGDGHYEARSLGPMVYKDSSRPLSALRPAIEIHSSPNHVAVCSHLLWQALNAENPVLRFVNLAICLELLVGAESPMPTRTVPRCSNLECSYILESCPACGKDWTIPNSLRERSSFLFDDAELLLKVITARNRVFHGGLASNSLSTIDELEQLNPALFIVLRNYLLRPFGVPPIKPRDLPLSVLGLDAMVSVFYSMPDGTC